MYNIQLTKEEADLFVEFRKYEIVFKTLLDSGVFDTKNGSAVLSFNSSGNLMQINFNVIKFKRKNLSTDIS